MFPFSRISCCSFIILPVESTACRCWAFIVIASGYQQVCRDTLSASFIDVQAIQHKQGQAEQNLRLEAAHTLRHPNTQLIGDLLLPLIPRGPKPARWEKPPATSRTSLWVRMTGDPREKRWQPGRTCRGGQGDLKQRCWRCDQQLTRMWSLCSAIEWWSWGSRGNKWNKLRLQWSSMCDVPSENWFLFAFKSVAVDHVFTSNSAKT